MQTWISPKTKKGLPSNIQGVGLFAIQNISKYEVIGIKAGHILTLEQVRALPFKNHPELQITDNLFICPITDTEHIASMLYINHSCNPNIGMRGDITFVAMRDIAAGEELTIDYAMIDNQEYSMLCACGSENCRKTITGQDYLLPELKKYGKYFSAYIQSKLSGSITNR